MELDEGIGGMDDTNYPPPYTQRQSSWSFGDEIGMRPFEGPYNQAPHGSDEDLLEDETEKSSPSSTRAARSGSPSGDERLGCLPDFGDDEGTTQGLFGTPERHIMLDEVQDDADAPVAEVRVPPDSEDEKLDG